MHIGPPKLDSFSGGGRALSRRSVSSRPLRGASGLNADGARVNVLIICRYWERIGFSADGAWSAAIRVLRIRWGDTIELFLLLIGVDNETFVR